MLVYIVTDPEAGWDCINAVYTDPEEAIKHCLDKTETTRDMYANEIRKMKNNNWCTISFHGRGMQMIHTMEVAEKYEE